MKHSVNIRYFILVVSLAFSLFHQPDAYAATVTEINNGLEVMDTLFTSVSQQSTSARRMQTLKGVPENPFKLKASLIKKLAVQVIIQPWHQLHDKWLI